jgi:hypothetical protein
MTSMTGRKTQQAIRRTGAYGVGVNTHRRTTSEMRVLHCAAGSENAKRGALRVLSKLAIQASNTS